MLFSFGSFKENRCKKSFGKIEMKLQSKVEHDELEKLKKIIDMKLRDIQGNIPENVEPQDGAAGIRKQLLPDFHCISCDKPVQVMQHEAVPSLPAGHSLPGKRSIRPYMTFELEEIRKHMRGTISSNKDRFDLAYEREKIQRQLLRLWFVVFFLIKLFILIPLLSGVQLTQALPVTLMISIAGSGKYHGEVYFNVYKFNHI